jgi:hypothetical protein
VQSQLQQSKGDSLQMTTFDEQAAAAALTSRCVHHWRAAVAATVQPSVMIGWGALHMACGLAAAVLFHALQLPDYCTRQLHPVFSITPAAVNENWQLVMAFIIMYFIMIMVWALPLHRRGIQVHVQSQVRARWRCVRGHVLPAGEADSVGSSTFR